MPTYEYACKACSERLEVVQSFSDAPLTECPACGGTLRKVFSPVGIAFKGSGFYKTDSRGSNGSKSTSTSEATKPESKSESSTTSSETTKSSETKKASDSSTSTTSSSTSSAAAS